MYSMQHIILIFITSFVGVLFALPSVITVAKLKGLFDSHNDRKLHKNKIPRLGGVAIFTSFSIAACLWGDASAPSLQYLTAGLIILFFAGLKDDIIMLSPINKLLVQIFVACLVCIPQGIRITNFHGLFGLNELSIYSSVLLSVFTLIVITNSFNLIDGVDGLAGGLGLIISISYAVWFYAIGDYAWSSLCFALAGSLFGFLFFNFSPAKIFMGDAGSLTIGFLIAVFSIKFIESGLVERTIPELNLSSAPALAIAVLIVPLYDTLRVFLIRALKKQSPFKADRNHIHHWLLKIGLNHREVCYALYGTNVLFITVAYMLRNTDILILTGIIISLAIVLGQLPIYIYQHKIADIDAENQDIDQEIEQLLNKKN